MHGDTVRVRGPWNRGTDVPGAHTPASVVRRFSVVMAILLASAIAGAPAPALAFVRATSFAYVSTLDSQIHVADADAVDIRTLGVAGMFPKWSPDGSRIAYYYTGDAALRVQIIDPSTDTIVDLSHPGFGDLSRSIFCWDLSSTGILHYVKASESPLLPEWWVRVPAVAWGDWHQSRVFGSYPYVTEAWPAPDGMYAVTYQPYTLDGSPPGRMMEAVRVGVIDAAGHIWKTAPIPAGATNASGVCVSPDGSKVVFSALGGGGTRSSVYLWDLGSDAVSVLYDAGDTYYNSAPRFTGDGASVVWTQVKSGESWADLWTVNLTTHAAVRLMPDAKQAAPKPAPLMPLASVSTPSGPSSIRHGRTFTVTGTVKPRHTSGTYLVTLYCYRLESGDWVLHKMVKAKRYALSSSASQYKATVSLPSAGSWRIRAFHIDAGHRPSWSGNRTVKVQ
jgi:hypothetical protein